MERLRQNQKRAIDCQKTAMNPFFFFSNTRDVRLLFKIGIFAGFMGGSLPYAMAMCKPGAPYPILQFTVESIKAKQKAVPFLLPNLKSSDRRVRWNTVKKLGEMGPVGSPAVPQLLQSLEDQDESVRYYAIEALGLIGSPKAVPA